MTLPFELQQLRVFKAISSERSFTKAAKKLYISQPCVSQQLKSLEKRLGVILVVRDTFRLELTAAGKIFLPYVERILALCEESCRSINDFFYGERGDFIVGGDMLVGSYLVPEILRLVLKANPEVQLQLQYGPTRFLMEQVIEGSIDLAVVCGDMPQNLTNELDIFGFVEDEFLLVAAESDPSTSQHRTIINKADLYNLNFIMLPSNCVIRKDLDKMLETENIDITKLNTSMQFDSIEDVKTSVALGSGVAFLPSSALEKELALESIRIIEIEGLTIHRTVSIVTPLNYKKSRVIEAFYEELELLLLEGDLVESDSLESDLLESDFLESDFF